MNEEVKVEKEAASNGAASSLPVQEQGQQQMSARLAVYEYIKRPDVQSQLYLNAQNLHNQFRGNRFTIESMLKKTNIKIYGEAKHLMLMLELAGLAHRETIKGVEKYKINLSVEYQITVLQLQMYELEMQKQAIQKHIDLLTTKLPKKEKV
jgi:hypothetical protein